MVIWKHTLLASFDSTFPRPCLANTGLKSRSDSTESCFFATVYKTFPSESATQSWVDVGCSHTTSTDSTLFWAKPTPTTSTSTTSSSSSSTSTTATPGPAQTETTSLSPNNPSITDAPEKAASKVWIAGAVLGPLAVGALLGLGFWLGWQRKGERTKSDIVLQRDETIVLPVYHSCTLHQRYNNHTNRELYRRLRTM
ncbi:hypothetical protein QBC38DRAFT_81964 [Podospora fimiseda]|uniref:Uncharacterized protein n=1 Tax=Podospora fimiseda TaxID=252190 RepID=A0AAN7BGQ0_9PEZI|nr:hypothetical protein QBC38DRAFT_81964 [Podospora fimiseda]